MDTETKNFKRDLKAMVKTLPPWVREGRPIQRKPCGRWCRILKLNPYYGVLVKDMGHAFWVSPKTIAEKWQTKGTSS